MTGNHTNRSAASGYFPYTSFDETAMLTRIGSELRDLYGNVEGVALPGDLMRLASLIDEKRAPGRKKRDRNSGTA